MSTLRRQIEQWIDETLDGMLRAPRLYGRVESVELQAILLLELRAFVANPELEGQEPRRVFNHWLAHFKARYPSAGSVLLASVLEQRGGSADGSHDDLARRLASFRESLVRELQPDNPFAIHDLALAIRIRKGGRMPSAARVGSFYGLVGQVMRSVARGGAGRGKPTRELEDAITVLPSGGLEIVPENGIGAQVVLPLRWPGSSRDSVSASATSVEFVREAFSRFVNVAEWASAEKEPIELLMQTVPDASTRTRFALDAMRLLPPAHGDIEAVELGGRAILRELPVSLRPEAQHRLLEVVTHDQQPSPFDARGILRIVDLDDGRLRLRNATDRVWEAVDVWFAGTDSAEGAAKMLGREVRVEGTRFLRANGQTFVIASTIGLTEVDDDRDEGSAA